MLPTPLAAARLSHDDVATPRVSATTAAPLSASLTARFLRILAAVGVEGALGAGFLLYLAWHNAALYGAFMYGLAAGAIASSVVQAGLYYPLVRDLAQVPRDAAQALVAKVLRLRLALAVVATAAVTAIAAWQAVPVSTAVVSASLSIGFALRACADTPLAALRLRGRQGAEARCRITAVLVAYAYAWACVWLGASAAVVSLFKPIEALVLLGLTWQALRQDHDARSGASHALPLRPLIVGAITLGVVDLLGTAYNKINVFFIQSRGGGNALALYGATWSVVDAVSLLGSEQLIACIVFPALALAWRDDPARALRLTRQQVAHLFVLGCAAAIVLRQEAPLILGLLYPAGYADSAGLQKILAFTVILSFEVNLFASLLIVAGAARPLLLLSALTALSSLALNAWLVPALGLPGACWAIVLTKLVMTVATGALCQLRFRLVPPGAWPAVLASTALTTVGWGALERYLSPHVGVALVIAVALAWWVGGRHQCAVPAA
jgi:O-antigen/teichoic acid export membrane protein